VLSFLLLSCFSLDCAMASWLAVTRVLSRFSL
jgi:hypothetical protein